MRRTPFIRALVRDSFPFIGCFLDYIINSQPISLLTSSAELEASNLMLGCEHANGCDSLSCSSAGTCNDYWTHKNCTCLDGYTGPRLVLVYRHMLAECNFLLCGLLLFILCGWSPIYNSVMLNCLVSDSLKIF